MPDSRPLPAQFIHYLKFKDEPLIELYHDLRTYLLELHPEGNELLYHTHALTSVFSVSERLGDAYCMIPIYTNHLNLGFNKGTLLADPNELLTGTGKLIRHIDVSRPEDYRTKEVETLVRAAHDFAVSDMDKPTKCTGETISKIKA